MADSRPTPHPAVRSPLRFCLSCGLTLLCWAVWLVLGATLASLAYVALARELPVPGFILRGLERRLADADLALHFERVRFDPQGRLLLEGVALRSTRFEEPLLSSRLLYLEGSIWSSLAGHATPDQIRLEGASLQLPAMLSPSGTAEPLMQDLAATLRHADGRWIADQLVFRTGPLAVTVEGEFVLPRRDRRTPWTLAEFVSSYLRLARPAARQLELLQRFDEPALTVRLESPANRGNAARLLFTTRSLRWPLGPSGPVDVSELTATAALSLGGDGRQPLRANLTARSAGSPKFAARGLRAIVQTSLTLPELALGLPEVWLTASQFTVSGETIDTPVVHAALENWPRLRVEASLVAGSEPLTAELDADLGDRTALLHLAGRADPAYVNALLARRTPRAAPWLVLQDPVGAEALLRFGQDWKFAGLEARLEGGRVDSRGVAIDSVMGRVRFDGRELLADRAVLRAGPNVARGSYWMDAGSRDFRILLAGELRPLAINGWFRRPWWAALWQDFDFTAAPPRADVDVAGRWTEPRLSRNFIGADAVAPRIRTAAFDRVRTRVFVRPHFVDGLHLDAVRAGGRETLRGTYGRDADPAGREPPRLRFDLASTVDPEIFDPLLRGAARPLLNDWRFRRPPHLQFAGTWTLRPAGGSGDLRFTAEAGGGLHYQGFPLDTLRAAGGLSGSELRLDQIEFTVANGRGRGKASLGGPPDARRLGFDVYLEGADLGPAVRAVQEYEAARTGTPVKAGTNSRFLRRAETSKLEVALSAVGRPGELASFQGSGNARLTGATLSEIHLFGLLSQVLSGLTLNFSTLKLDTIHGSFELADGRVHFPDLKVTGDSAIIDARGDYTFADSGLNFTARFKPYGENRNIITGTLGLVLNPLTSIIELKLSGPLSQPEWSYSLGSSPTESRPPAAVSPAGTTPAPPQGTVPGAGKG